MQLPQFANGNRVSRTAKATGAVETNSYDSQNRLVGYASPTTTATYAYDALDRRIAKVADAVVGAHVHDAWALRSTIVIGRPGRHRTRRRCGMGLVAVAEAW